MAGCIRDNKPPFRGGEIAIGDIDRNTLFPLRFETIGEEGIVEVNITVGRGIMPHRFQLVLKDGLRIIQETPDQG
jgi:hypothetical protein